MDKNYIIQLQSDCISYSRKLERIRRTVDELREMLGFYNRRLSELDYGLTGIYDCTECCSHVEVVYW